MTNPIIKPSVGRVVWFYPGKDAPYHGTTLNSEQPMAAIVTFVHDDSMVNLLVTDHVGVCWGISSVLLVQDGPRPVGDQFCEWMPYQKGQASKTEAAEKAVVLNGPYNGTPRDPRDVASDPQATLCVKPGEPLKAAAALTFGDALGLLKQGVPVARLGWNGKGMFVYLVPAASYPVQTGAAKAHFGEGAMVPYNAYMAIKNVDNTVSTWVPSVNDCLAEDWVSVGGPAASAVPPHQQRVLDERAELKDRHSKLSAFILDNPIFLNLPEAEQARLQKQEQLQAQLLDVLDERIAAF